MLALNRAAPADADFVLLNAREAAARLRIGSRLLWTLTNSGQIAHVRIGRAVRYRDADLRAFVERQVKGGPRG